jgi:hypothetical protein
VVSSNVVVTDPVGISVGPGAQYSITSSPSAQTLDVLSGTITLTASLLTEFPNFDLKIENGGLVVLQANEIVNQVQLLGTGTLDVAAYALNINYAAGALSSPDAMIRAAVTSGAGANGDSYNGTGIISSTAAGLNAAQVANGGTPAYGVGYADGSDPYLNGEGPPAGVEEIKMTLLGDLNLDGNVNSADFILLSDSFGQAGGAAAAWDHGDLNYDGSVNAADFILFSNNFGKSLGSVSSLNSSVTLGNSNDGNLVGSDSTAAGSIDSNSSQSTPTESNSTGTGSAISSAVTLSKTAAATAPQAPSDPPAKSDAPVPVASALPPANVTTAALTDVKPSVVVAAKVVGNPIIHQEPVPAVVKSANTIVVNPIPVPKISTNTLPIASAKAVSNASTKPAKKSAEVAAVVKVAVTDSSTSPFSDHQVAAAWLSEDPNDLIEDPISQ